MEPKILASTPASAEVVAPAPANFLSECLPPIETFEYKFGEVPFDFDWSEVTAITLPPVAWQKTTNIPDASSLTLIQSRNDETIFWLRANKLVRYRVTGGNWNEGSLLPGPTDNAGISLFLDRKNNVWGARYNEFNSGDPFGLLNRYNEQTNQWEPVALDLANQDKLATSHVEVDDQGKFWLLEMEGEGYKLFRFDPETGIVERHLTEFTLHNTFTISQSVLYITAVSSDPTPRYLLLKYPLDGSAVKVEYIPQYLYYSYQRFEYPPERLFVDKEQRVWIGARGWLDLVANEWHFIIPDPVFLTVLMGAGDWRWDEPDITYETPDGLLWHESLRGTGWVDPESGKWCVFTSYRSNVLADSQGNLWILVDEWLYRLEQ